MNNPVEYVYRQVGFERFEVGHYDENDKWCRVGRRKYRADAESFANRLNEEAS